MNVSIFSTLCGIGLLIIIYGILLRSYVFYIIGILCFVLAILYVILSKPPTPTIRDAQITSKSVTSVYFNPVSLADSYTINAIGPSMKTISTTVNPGIFTNLTQGNYYFTISSSNQFGTSNISPNSQVYSITVPVAPIITNVTIVTTNFVPSIQVTLGNLTNVGGYATVSCASSSFYVDQSLNIMLTSVATDETALPLVFLFTGVAPNNYTITATQTDALGTSPSTSQTILIPPPPPAPVFTLVQITNTSCNLTIEDLNVYNYPIRSFLISSTAVNSTTTVLSETLGTNTSVTYTGSNSIEVISNSSGGISGENLFQLTNIDISLGTPCRVTILAQSDYGISPSTTVMFQPFILLQCTILSTPPVTFGPITSCTTSNIPRASYTVFMYDNQTMQFINVQNNTILYQTYSPSVCIWWTDGSTVNGVYIMSLDTAGLSCQLYPFGSGQTLSSSLSICFPIEFEYVLSPFTVISSVVPNQTIVPFPVSYATSTIIGSTSSLVANQGHTNDLYTYYVTYGIDPKNIAGMVLFANSTGALVTESVQYDSSGARGYYLTVPSSFEYFSLVWYNVIQNKMCGTLVLHNPIQNTITYQNLFGEGPGTDPSGSLPLQISYFSDIPPPPLVVATQIDNSSMTISLTNTNRNKNISIMSMSVSCPTLFGTITINSSGPSSINTNVIISSSGSIQNTITLTITNLLFQPGVQYQLNATSSSEYGTSSPSSTTFTAFIIIYFIISNSNTVNYTFTIVDINSYTYTMTQTQLPINTIDARYKTYSSTVAFFVNRNDGSNIDFYFIYQINSTLLHITSSRSQNTNMFGFSTVYSTPVWPVTYATTQTLLVNDNMTLNSLYNGNQNQYPSSIITSYSPNNLLGSTMFPTSSISYQLLPLSQYYNNNFNYTYYVYSQSNSIKCYYAYDGGSISTITSTGPNPVQSTNNYVNYFTLSLDSTVPNCTSIMVIDTTNFCGIVFLIDSPNNNIQAYSFGCTPTSYYPMFICYTPLVPPPPTINSLTFVNNTTLQIIIQDQNINLNPGCNTYSFDIYAYSDLSGTVIFHLNQVCINIILNPTNFPQTFNLDVTNIQLYAGKTYYFNVKANVNPDPSNPSITYTSDVSLTYNYVASVNVNINLLQPTNLYLYNLYIIDTIQYPFNSQSFINDINNLQNITNTSDPLYQNISSNIDSISSLQPYKSNLVNMFINTNTANTSTNENLNAFPSSTYYSFLFNSVVSQVNSNLNFNYITQSSQITLFLEQNLDYIYNSAADLINASPITYLYFIDSISTTSITVYNNILNLLFITNKDLVNSNTINLQQTQQVQGSCLSGNYYYNSWTNSCTYKNWNNANTLIISNNAFNYIPYSVYGFTNNGYLIEIDQLSSSYMYNQATPDGIQGNTLITTSSLNTNGFYINISGSILFPFPVSNGKTYTFYYSGILDNYQINYASLINGSQYIQPTSTSSSIMVYSIYGYGIPTKVHSPTVTNNTASIIVDSNCMYYIIYQTKNVVLSKGQKIQSVYDGVVLSFGKGGFTARPLFASLWPTMFLYYDQVIVSQPLLTCTYTSGSLQVTITDQTPPKYSASALSYELYSLEGFVDTNIIGGSTVTLSISITLQPAVYHFYARAVTAFGISPIPSIENMTTVLFNFTEKPSITSVDAGNQQATVRFTTLVSGGGLPIVNYIVTSTSGNITASGSSSPIIITGLTNGITYSFTLVAQNSSGGTSTRSSVSSSVTPFSVPITPTITNVTAADSTATVSFTTPLVNGNSQVTTYTVTSSPGNITNSGTSSPILITGLTNGTSYTFTITATNSYGTSLPSSPIIYVTPGMTPGVPTILSATANRNGQATITFTSGIDTNNGSGNLPVSYTTTSSPGGIVTTGIGGGMIINGLTNGVSYTFTVTATNSYGTSAPSLPSASVTPFSAPDPPTITSVQAGNGQVTVTFTAPTNTGGLPINTYTVYPTPNPSGQLAVTGTSSPITVTGLTNGTAYTFTVIAINSDNVASYDSVASASIIPFVIIPTTTSPDPPTISIVVAVNQKATVTISAPINNGGSPILQYNIYVAFMNGSPFFEVITTQLTDNVFYNLTNGVSYTFTATATNSIGASARSTPYVVTVTFLATVPDAPGTPVAVASSLLGPVPPYVTIVSPTNNGGSDIISYTITSSSTSNQPIVTLPTQLLYNNTITGLVAGASYTFTVTATNSIGTSSSSPPSNTIWVLDPTPPVLTYNNSTASGQISFPTVAGATYTVAYMPNADSGDYTYATIPSTWTSTTMPSSSSPITISNLPVNNGYQFFIITTTTDQQSFTSQTSNGIIVNNFS